MSLLLVLAYPACSVIEDTVPRGREDDEPRDTAGDADADTDADADADADADTGGGGPDVDPITWTVDTLDEFIAADTSSWVSGVWFADVTGDDIDDLVLVRNRYDRSGSYHIEVAMYASRGNGRFEAPSVTDGPGGLYSYWSPLLGDFDDDGQVDLAVLGSNTVSLFRGNHRGFGEAVTTTTGSARGSYNESFGAADFDGDGVIELAVMAYVSRYQYGEVRCFEADASGQFSPTFSTWTAAYYTYSMAAVDLDGTGRESAVFGDFTTGYGYDQQISLVESWGSDYLSVLTGYPTRFSNDGTMFGFGSDVNRDGREELISQGVDGLQVYDPEVGHAEFLRMNDFVTYPMGLVGYDLDGNGEEDALEHLYHYETTEFATSYGVRLAWSMQDDDGFRTSASLDFDLIPGNFGAASIAAGDPNADGCGDVALIDGYGAVHLGFGDCGD
jgi:hypothetical protein